MAYASIDDLKTRYGDKEILMLTDLDQSNKINTRLCSIALNDASNVVDSYVSSVVEVPMLAPAPIIKSVVSDIARYMLHTKNTPETVERRYKDAISTLESIRDGDISINGSTQSETTTTAGLVDHTTRDRIFTMDSMRGF